MRDETDNDEPRSRLSDIATLIGGCIAVFVGVFYFDTISGQVKDEYATVRDSVKTTLAPTPAPNAKPTASSIQPNRSQRTAFLTADRYNQFFADAYINGTRVSVLVDTGASHVSLRFEDAQRLGIYVTDKDFTHSARTANGIARIAPVEIDRIRIGEVEARDIDGFVGEPGKNFSTLLGMTFLRKLSGMKITGRQMELIQ